MSLKLGDTNIAGTQILYSTTGNNTDGAMTQAATTTELNNCVHKTDNETINGSKTFTSSVKVSKASPYVDLYNTNVTKGTVPSSLQIARNAMVDKDGKNMAMTQYQYNTAGEIQAVLRAYNPNNETDFEQISLWYPPTGNPYTYAPASDVNNSIVTTISKSKAANGYFQLGNGLIINWGSYTYSDGATHTITFPKAFSSTNYSISFGHQLKESSTCDFYGPQITNGTKNTTSCTVYARNAGTARSANILWIAIGY